MTDPQVSIVLNGDRCNVPAGSGLLALIDHAGLPVQAVLIEHNGRALLREEWPDVCLAENDRLEVLRIVAGG